MPEVGVSKEMKHALDLAYENRGHIWGWDEIKTEIGGGLKHIGDGSEVVVLQDKDPNMSERGGKRIAVAIEYLERSPERMKQQFYLQRVMEALFPHNFPHFCAGWGQSEQHGHQAVTVREIIEDPEEKGKEVKSMSWRKAADIESKYDFRKVFSAIDELGLPVWVDGAGKNFGLGADGGMYYLDQVMLMMGNWDEKAIDEYMEREKIGAERADIARSSIGRLKALRGW